MSRLMALAPVTVVADACEFTVQMSPSGVDANDAGCANEGQKQVRTNGDT